LGLDLLIARKPFNKPQYDEKTLVRLVETKKVMPCEVIIVEGHLIFSNQELLSKFDLKIFIDADDDVRLSRRVMKLPNEVKEDSTLLSNALYNYEKHVKPAYERFIEPTKKLADIILPNYGFAHCEDVELNAIVFPTQAIDIIAKTVDIKMGSGGPRIKQ